MAELEQPVGRDRRRARDQEARLPPEEPEEAERDADREQRPEHDLRGARLAHVSVYSGPEPPSGGVRRPPLAVIAPHWTQFDGVTSTTTLPSPSSSPTS